MVWIRLWLGRSLGSKCHRSSTWWVKTDLPSIYPLVAPVVSNTPGQQELERLVCFQPERERVCWS